MLDFADWTDRLSGLILRSVWSTNCECVWSHWISHHGVGLPRAGLTVGEDAGVVALKRRLQHVRAQIFENLQTK